MKPIPRPLYTAFSRDLGTLSLSNNERQDWLKWLRFYLDFCAKYRYPPREKESLQQFLHKLGKKKQSGERQAQAMKSISMFYDVVQQFPRPGTGGPENVKEADAWEKLFVKLTEQIKVRQYSPKTLKAYAGWARQFQVYLESKAPEALDDDDAARFLTYIATEKNVVATTQNQAFNALLFFFRHVLDKPYELGEKVVRARRKRYIPVVLTREEIDRVLFELPYPHNLIARLMYGCGLRQAELLNLRINCFNFDDAILTVHDGKGGKDRAVPLPHTVIPDLRAHRDRVRALYERDLSDDFAGAFMPRGAASKWKSRSREWTWQFFFPAKTLTLVPEEGEYRRYHLHETHFGKALRMAARRTKLDKRVTSHTFRHSFASHLLLANYDIRTVQEMMGHSDVRTTMIYTQTVPSRTKKQQRSPLDFETGREFAAGIPTPG
jgi:integron integrase